MESENQRSIIELEQLDPTRKVGWEMQLEFSKKLYEERGKYLSNLKALARHADEGEAPEGDELLY